MNISSQRISKLLLIAFGLFLGLASASGALSIVWMRQQINKTALQTSSLEKQLNEADRKNNYLQAEIAAYDNPSYLRQKFSGNLISPKKEQVVWVEKQRQYWEEERLQRNPQQVALSANHQNNPLML